MLFTKRLITHDTCLSFRSLCGPACVAVFPLCLECELQPERDLQITRFGSVFSPSFFFLYPSTSGMLSLGAAYCMLICSLTGATYKFECMPEKPCTDRFYEIVCFWACGGGNDAAVVQCCHWLSFDSPNLLPKVLVPSNSTFMSLYSLKLE